MVFLYQQLGPQPGVCADLYLLSLTSIKTYFTFEGGSNGTDSHGAFSFPLNGTGDKSIDPTHISKPVRWGFKEIIAQLEENDVQNGYHCVIHGVKSCANNTETVTYSIYSYSASVSCFCIDNCSASTSDNRVMWKTA